MRVTPVVLGWFKLDGGAMFGSVPKALWNRWIAADDKNRILMAARSLLIEVDDRRILVDTGFGDGWDEKQQLIFDFSLVKLELGDVTDVVLTHLHFDHAGGAVLPDGSLAWPGAKHWVSSENYENARSPNVRERASYLPRIVDPLASANLVLTEDNDSIAPGVSVHRSDGHTRGLQWVLAGGVAFPSDLMPTSHHLQPAYAMGYDICAETVLREREVFARQAAENSWEVVFQHDPQVQSARLTLDEQGRVQLLGPRQATGPNQP